MAKIELHRTEMDGEQPRWKISLTEDSVEVSRLWVFIKDIWIGKAKLTLGGIGSVETNQGHRYKGYAAKIMNESTRLMEDEGYHLGFLYGIENFYHRFGYAVAFANSVLEVQADELLRAKKFHRFRTMRKTDGSTVARLYNRLNRGRTGNVVRHPDTWRSFENFIGFKRPGPAILVCNETGNVEGYACYKTDNGRCLVSEIGGFTSDAYNSLSVYLGRRAHRAGIDSVVFHLPADHGFAQYASRYHSRLIINSTRNSGPMGRIIQQSILMKRMTPELSNRLDYSKINCDLSFTTELGKFGFSIHNSDIRVTSGNIGSKIHLPQMVLTQLLLGYRTVLDIFHDEGVHIPKKTVAILYHLFPKKSPYMWWSDRF